MEEQLEFDFMEKSAVTNRKLTIVLDVLDKEKAQWLWDNHLNGDTSSGIRVTSISNGDLVEKNTILEDLVNEMRDNSVVDNSFMEEIDLRMETYDSL